MSDATESAELMKMPAAQPPQGVTPNFTNPYSDAPTFIIVSSILVALTLAFVAVRIYTKVRIVGKYTPDDYTCVIGTVGIVVMFSLSIVYIIRSHIGTHMWDLTLGDLTDATGLYCLFFINIISCLILLLVKLSFFLMYLQIFHPMKWLRYGSYVGATINVLYYSAIVIATLAYSIPTPGQTLQQAVQTQRYRRLINLSLPAASMSLILDVYILVLPIAGVAKLQLPPQRKALVMLVFLMGFIACIASSMSIYYKWLLQNDQSDITFVDMPTLLLGLAELCTGAIASCMPSMTAFLRHLPTTLSSSSSSNTKANKGAQGESYNSSTTAASLSYKESKNRYKNLDNMGMSVIGGGGERGGSEYEMRKDKVLVVPPNAKTVRTFVHTGGKDEVEEDGIHLQYDIDRKVSPSTA